MSLIVFVLLQYLDLVTTVLMIGAGGHELNPLINYLGRYFPSQMVELIVVKVLTVLGAGFVYYKIHPLLNTKNLSPIKVAWYILIGWYVIVVSWNLLGMLSYMYT